MFRPLSSFDFLQVHHISVDKNIEYDIYHNLSVMAVMEKISELIVDELVKSPI